MRSILEIARLIRVLEDESITKETKISQIKFVMNNGHITKEEAVVLTVEYL